MLAGVNAVVLVTDSLITSSVTGVSADPGSSVTLSRDSLFADVTAINGLTLSFLNNVIVHNVSDGTQPQTQTPR